MAFVHHRRQWCRFWGSYKPQQHWKRGSWLCPRPTLTYLGTGLLTQYEVLYYQHEYEVRGQWSFREETREFHENSNNHEMTLTFIHKLRPHIYTMMIRRNKGKPTPSIEQLSYYFLYERRCQEEDGGIKFFTDIFKRISLLNFSNPHGVKLENFFQTVTCTTSLTESFFSNLLIWLSLNPSILATGFQPILLRWADKSFRLSSQIMASSFRSLPFPYPVCVTH